MADSMTSGAKDALEIEILVKAIYDCYGYDFREYAPASLARRVHATLVKHGLQTISELTQKVIHSPEFFARLLDNLTVTVTEMFRDPTFYLTLREKVFPYLQTYPELKTWIAGCATGEEVYSVAILKKETGLYDRSLLYGTDINPRALARAREGILALGNVAKADRLYRDSGGKRQFSDYYVSKYDAAIFDSSLKEKLVLSDHNLVTDSHFGEMNLILCRNVLIYFSPALQRKVLKTLWGSLRPGGFLCVGSRERVDCERDLPGCFTYSKTERIFQKKA